MRCQSDVSLCHILLGTFLLWLPATPLAASVGCRTLRAYISVSIAGSTKYVTYTGKTADPGGPLNDQSILSYFDATVVTSLADADVFEFDSCTNSITCVGCDWAHGQYVSLCSNSVTGATGKYWYRLKWTPQAIGYPLTIFNGTDMCKSDVWSASVFDELSATVNWYEPDLNEAQYDDHPVCGIDHYGILAFTDDAALGYTPCSMYLRPT